MFFKNIFKKTSTNQNTHNQTGQKSENLQQQEVQSTSPLIDNTIDTRYNQYTGLPHNLELKIPLTFLHQKQLVVLSEHNIVQCKNIHAQTMNQVNIIMSDRQIIISPNVFQLQNVSNCLVISYGFIEKIEIINNKKEQLKINLFLKDNRQLVLSSVIGDIIFNIQKIIKSFAFVAGINKFYAFRFGSFKTYNFNGWSIYNIQRQFQRQGIQIAKSNQQGQNYSFKYLNNRNGQICATYSELIVVPYRIKMQQIVKCSKFRTKERVPALTYALKLKDKFSVLFRSSQNKVGMMNARSRQDQYMIQCIGQPIITGRVGVTCKIYDARGYYAALGNMFAGKGYQKQQYYKNCQITFLDIPNIHAVRQSYNMLKAFNIYNDQFIKVVGDSGWYDYLYLIIAGAKSIAIDLIHGTNVLVHCSDGWDRTSQLVSLAQIILDPYFRSIQGLCVLIQKDWRHFGHKFRERTGQYRPSNYHSHEKSPIFIQFLDCIYQLIRQFPLSFEYSDRLLLFLSQVVSQCTYGTFLAISYLEGKTLRLQQNTHSVWSYVMQNKTLFMNPYFKLGLEQQWIHVSSQVKYLSIWKEHFLGSSHTDIEYNSMQQQYEINKALKQQYYHNQQIIKQLNQELSKTKKKNQ